VRGARYHDGIARRQTIIVGALALATAGGLAVSARAWSFLCDDAFISFRYARNLARHGALEFNLGERVEGYTNFAWVVLLALFDRIGLAPETMAPIFDAGFAAAALGAVAWLVHGLRQLGPQTGGGDATRLKPIDLVAPAMLVAIPEFAVWSSGGLETAAAAATTLGAMAAFVHRRLRLAAGLAAAAGLTRPDSLLPIAVFGLAWLVVVGLPRVLRDRTVLRELPRRQLAYAVLIFAVPLLGHLLWRHAYYGAWVPNTWSIKTHGALLRESYGIAYVRAWVDAVHLVALAPLIVLVRPRHLITLLPTAAIVVYGWSIGGDFMAYSRFYIVATALLAASVAWVLADAARLLSRLIRHPVAVEATCVALGLAMAVALGVEARDRYALDRSTGAKWIDGRWEGVTAMDRFARVGVAVGRWMHDNLPPDTLMTVGAAGAVPYGSQLPTIDAYGLVDPKIARLPSVKPLRGERARPGHQLVAPVSYIKQLDPDLLCHVGYRGAKRPRPGWTHKAFRFGYDWACIDPGPIEDPSVASGQMEPLWYCCRRPVDRVVGPFGPQEGQ
jgi:arabinofuranosyltransferase